MRMERTMTDADDPKCFCTHYRSVHDHQPNPKCRAGVFGYPCDCPGFEPDPKANAQ